MSIKDILQSKDHRPWDLPNKPWSFHQEWNDVVFLHWSVNEVDLRQFVPLNLEIDVFDQKAWVSVVIFKMEKIRARNLPYFSPISNFNEINIRTYVKKENKSGVYFLNIEGGKRISCAIAKGVSELTYRFSKIKRNNINYINSYNTAFEDRISISYQLGENIEHPDKVDNWLTERYALFQDGKNGLNYFDIHHLKWSLRKIKIEDLNFNYPRFRHLLKGDPDRVNYSEGVQVVAWNKEIV